MGGREKAAQQAEALRQQALRLAAGQRLGISQDQMMLLGDNVGSVVAGQMKPQEGPKPGSFEWWSDPSRTPQEKATFAAYRDANTPEEPRMVTLPDGRAIFGTMDEIQRIIGGVSAGGATPARPVGNLTPVTGGSGGNVGGGFR